MKLQCAAFGFRELMSWSTLSPRVDVAAKLSAVSPRPSKCRGRKVCGKADPDARNWRCQSPDSTGYHVTKDACTALRASTGRWCWRNHLSVVITFPLYVRWLASNKYFFVTTQVPPFEGCDGSRHRMQGAALPNDRALLHSRVVPGPRPSPWSPLR